MTQVTLPFTHGLIQRPVLGDPMQTATSTNLTLSQFQFAIAPVVQQTKRSRQTIHKPSKKKAGAN